MLWVAYWRDTRAKSVDCYVVNLASNAYAEFMDTTDDVRKVLYHTSAAWYEYHKHVVLEEELEYVGQLPLVLCLSDDSEGWVYSNLNERFGNGT